jgi:UDP-N-acetylmuramate dehydrogenase
MTLSQDGSLSAPALLQTGPVPSFANLLAKSPTQHRLPDSDCVIKANVPLARLTSFQVWGPAEWYAAPHRLEDFQACIAWAKAEGLPLKFLGAGSNLLISDRGLPGLVLGARRLRNKHFDSNTGQVTVSAGTPLPKLAWMVADLGWSGLEWIVGIPGSVGGAVVMNAGAHTGCVADCLVHTRVLRPDGTIVLLTPQDLDYQYRTSNLQGRDWLVLDATFELSTGHSAAEITAVTERHLTQRKASQPYHLPNCGSVFRNPDQYKAGWLIEQSGLKGYQIGGAQVAERHANFILNCGSATAADIFRLIRHVQSQVQSRWSVDLETEVKLLGDFQLA